MKRLSKKRVWDLVLSAGMCVGALFLVLHLTKDVRGRTILGVSSEMTDVAAIRSCRDGSVLLFGAFRRGFSANEVRPTGVDLSVARIVRVTHAGRPAPSGIVVYDGEGTVIDVSQPSDRTFRALKRRVRMSSQPGGRSEIVYSCLSSDDFGDTWRETALPNATSVSNIEFWDDQHGIVTSYNLSEAFLTDDGGITWSQPENPTGDGRQLSVPRLLSASVRDTPSKTTLAFEPTGGVVAFNPFARGRIEIRDRELRVVQTLELGDHSVVECIARLDRDRAVVFLRRKEGNTYYATALPLYPDGLALGAPLHGLPPDFSCQQADGIDGRVLVTGISEKSASIFGLTHLAYVYARGETGFRRLPSRTSYSL